MKDMKVVSISKEKKDKRKIDLLEVLDEIREQVESGEIQELVATSMTTDGAQIHISCLDFHGGVGLFEIGKIMFVQQIEFEGE
jgi:hypothetical protein